MNMLIPILIIVASNTVYNICAMSTPEGINTFASLTVTYLVAAGAALAMFFITGRDRNLSAELAKVNWSQIALGISIVGLESGFILAFRAGWKIGLAQLVASVTVSCILIIIGYLVYKEVLSVRQFVGIGICAVGLFLITK